MKNPAFHLCRPLAQISVALLLAASAAAQTQPSTSPQAPDAAESSSSEQTIRLSEFNVASTNNGWAATNSLTGTRTNIPLKDLPRSIQVLTSEFMGDVGARDVVTASSYIAGVSPQGNQGQMNDDNTYQVRGFRQNKLFRDGVKETFASVMNDAADIDRVEYLAGPSSLLAGVSDPGGEINVISMRPEPVRAQTLTLTGDEWGARRAVVDANNPVSKNVQTRVILAGQYGNGYEPDTFTDEQLAFGAVTAKFFRNTVYQGTIEYIHYVTDPAPGIISIPGPPTQGNTNVGLIAATPNQTGIILGQNVNGVFIPWNFNPDGIYTRRTQNQTTFNNQIEQPLGDHWDLRLMGNYLWLHRVDRRPTSSGTVTTQVVNGVLVPYSVPMTATNDDEHIPTYDTQLDAVGKYSYFGINEQILLGAEYIDFDDARTRYNTAANVMPPYIIGAGDRQPGQYNLPPTLYTSPSFLQNNKQNRRALSLTSITGLWGDRIHVMGGVRYDESTDTNRNGAATTPIGKYEPVSEHFTSPTVGAIVDALKKDYADTSVYYSYSESDAGPPVSNHDDTGRTLDKQVLGAGYDFGIKASFLKNRVSLDLAGFKITEKNAVVQMTNAQIIADGFNPALTGASYQQNQNITSRGWDADITITPFTGYQVLAVFTHLKAYIAADPLVPTLVGAPINNGSGQKWGSIFQKYEIPGGPLKGLAFTWGTIYQDGRRSFNTNQTTGYTVYLPAYTRQDFGVSDSFNFWHLKESVNFWVMNAFDKQYFEDYQNRGLPRTWTLSVGLTY